VAEQHALPEGAEQRFWQGVADAERFFMGEAQVQKALEKLARALDALRIRYAVVGALALNEFGHRRVTVDIDVVLTGAYPGDGRPKPVAFPDPGTVATRGTRVALLPLTTLIELKLASGMTAPHRLKDLADVLEVIRTLDLPVSFAADVHEYVREKYVELWHAAQTREPEA
jgi:hypothetical protein